ncbi:hypothetical protein K435DRAFT_881604, partial [Dendrothele bispora CBS 962.96]
VLNRPATAGPSNYPGALVPYSAQSSTLPSALHRPATAGPSNYAGALVPYSNQSPTPPSSGLHRPQSIREAQIFGVNSEGNKRLLATLEESEIDDFEELSAMGFPQQATIEAYLTCGKNKEHAAVYLLENSSDVHSSDPESTENGASQSAQTAQICVVDSEGKENLIATLEGSQIDGLKQLEALGFPRLDTLAVYLACGKNPEIAASILVENGGVMDSDSSSMPGSGSPKPPMTLPAETPVTGDTQTVPAPAPALAPPEISTLSLAPPEISTPSLAPLEISTPSAL